MRPLARCTTYQYTVPASMRLQMSYGPYLPPTVKRILLGCCIPHRRSWILVAFVVRVANVIAAAVVGQGGHGLQRVVGLRLTGMQAHRLVVQPQPGAVGVAGEDFDAAAAHQIEVAQFS